jgi:hypothetical protein
MDDDDEQEPPTIPKPDELLALHDVTAEMFSTLRRWFDVPPAVTLDLADIDSAVAELSDPVLIAAMAMRKLQALHLLSTPGVVTTTDVVVTMVGDLDRALLQAPAMRLKQQAASTDWDAELALLDEGVFQGAESRAREPGSVDEDAERFREMHGRLHLAVHAVLEASGGEIRLLS